MGTNDFLVVGQWLRICYFLLTVSFIVAAYHLARLHLSPEYALAATLVCALYFFVYYCADTLYADIPFALTTVLFVLCDRKAGKIVSGIAAGVLAAASYLLRTAGIALLVAWVAESLLRGRYRQTLLRAAIALVPIVLWQAHIVRVLNSQQYHATCLPVPACRLSVFERHLHRKYLVDRSIQAGARPRRCGRDAFTRWQEPDQHASCAGTAGIRPSQFLASGGGGVLFLFPFEERTATAASQMFLSLPSGVW